MEPLPKSSNKYWTEVEADVNKVDLALSPDELCRDHEVIVDAPNRECKCARCPYGFRFRVDQVKVEDDVLTVLQTSRKFKILSIKK